MSLPQYILYALPCATVLLVGCSQTVEEPQKVWPDTLDGVWELRSGPSGIPSFSRGGDRYEFDGDRYRLTRRWDGVGPWRAITIDESVNPKQITGLLGDPMGSGEVGSQRLAYEINNDKVEFRIPLPDRETHGARLAHTGRSVLRLSRVQPVPKIEKRGRREDRDAETSAFYILGDRITAGRYDNRFFVDFGKTPSYRPVLSKYWQSILDLHKIRSLLFRGCSYVEDKHMPVVGTLTPLEQLDLHGTDVGDAGVASLAKLPNLQDLDLSLTTVSDAAVDDLLKMETLQTLDLSGTRVTSDGISRLCDRHPRPVWLTPASGQKPIHFEGLEVKWTRPYTESELAAARALTRLELEIVDEYDYQLEESVCRVEFPPYVRVQSVTTVPGEEPPLVPTSPLGKGRICFDASVVGKHLGKLPAPTAFKAGGRIVDDSIFVAIRSMQGLARLDLSQSANITDDGVRQLKHHKSLRILELTSAKGLTDACMPVLGTLPNLEVLELENTGVTREGAELLGNRSRLERLEIDR